MSSNELKILKHYQHIRERIFSKLLNYNTKILLLGARPDHISFRIFPRSYFRCLTENLSVQAASLVRMTKEKTCFSIFC